MQTVVVPDDAKQFEHKWICPSCKRTDLTLRRISSIGKVIQSWCVNCGKKVKLDLRQIKIVRHKDVGNDEPVLLSSIEAVEEMAAHIATISEMVDAIRRGPLKEEAIVILLHYKTKVPMGKIREILNGLSHLREWYTTPVEEE